MSNNEANWWPVRAIRVHPVGFATVPMNGNLRGLRWITKVFCNGWNAALRHVRQHPDTVLPSIERVIFNNPATIVYWSDGTKTVVKCQPGDTFSTETGLMAAMLKRFLGNDNSYNKVINHWLTTTSLPALPEATEDHDV